MAEMDGKLPLGSTARTSTLRHIKTFAFTLAEVAFRTFLDIRFAEVLRIAKATS
ncbi:hypothetical protein [Mesorhizobium delmotii]|uniref:hypothetical protein n=1 Tax=Mesorhizobium delmotii TaxID=1631247 RepID=UPI0014035386|nr:hypothetical protein [Mesorhizobium delmotii]